MDYAKMKKVQLIEEIEALEKKIAELEHAEAGRKPAEEALRASARQWQATFDAVSDAVCLLNLEGGILRCNVAMTNLLGKPFGEIIGRTCWELVHGTSEPIEGCPIVRMRETRRRETLVLPMGERWLEVSVDPLLDEAGNLISAVHIISDITERRRGEEALQESEEKYRNVVERANDGICIIQDTIVTYLNPRLAEMWGGTIEEVIGTPFTNYVHPEELPKVVDRYKQRMTGEDVIPVYETVLKHKDGSKVYAELNAGVITYQGKPANLVFVRDITERQRAEEALRESEERFRRLYERAPLGYQSLDAEGRLIDVNQAWLDLLGYSRDQVIGHWFSDFLAPQEVDAFKQRFPRFKATGEVHVDLEMVQRVGSTILVHIDGRIGHDEHGQFKQTHCILHDITARKRAEEALWESEERYRSLFERVPAGLYRTTPEGQILDVNPALVQMLEYPDRESLLAINVIDGYVNPQVRKQWQALVEREGVVRDFEVQWRRHDGTTIWVRENARVVRDGEGQVLYYEGAGEDITERKRAEEA
ncbi:MAG: PAS domain S-box protein, partial [Anaerolineae bacterium]